MEREGGLRREGRGGIKRGRGGATHREVVVDLVRLDAGVDVGHGARSVCCVGWWVSVALNVGTSRAQRVATRTTITTNESSERFGTRSPSQPFS